jgi:signal recognition particle GTPase
MVSFKRKVLTSAVSAALFLAGGVTTVSLAQNTQSTQESQQLMDITDVELLTFAQAIAAVEQVQKKYQSLAQNVENETQMQKLQQDANQEMVAALDQADISVERYNAIFAQVQSDEQTRNRLMRLMGKEGN